jgi:Asp-tRNA(Asn)/Glu-tRNA(Gln) amidotransferase A subunit family amidase
LIPQPKSVFQPLDKIVSRTLPFPKYDVLSFAPQQLTTKLVDLNELHGLPCSIQIIAPHFYDEELLRAVKIIDKVLKP